MTGIIGIFAAAIVGSALAIVAGFGLVSLSHTSGAPIDSPLVVYGNR